MANSVGQKPLLNTYNAAVTAWLELQLWAGQGGSPPPGVVDPEVGTQSRGPGNPTGPGRGPQLCPGDSFLHQVLRSVLCHQDQHRLPESAPGPRLRHHRALCVPRVQMRGVALRSLGHRAGPQLSQGHIQSPGPQQGVTSPSLHLQQQGALSPRPAAKPVCGHCHRGQMGGGHRRHKNTAGEQR